MKITTKQLYFLFVLIVALGVAYFADKYYTPHDFSEMDRAEIILMGETIHVRVAETPADQEKGLMGVTAISDREGMVFPFAVARAKHFWNNGMVMPFDLLWIRNGRVIGIEKNIPVPDTSSTTYSSPSVVDHVLELSGGWSDRHGLRVGDKIIGL